MGRASGLAMALALCQACAPVQQARLDPLADPMPREIEAAATMSSCAPFVDYVWPGSPQLCREQPVGGAILVGAGAAQLGAGIGLALANPTGPTADTDPSAGSGLMVPFVGFQDAWVIGIGAGALHDQAAAGRLYVPQDTLGEMAAAPFNGHVLQRPAVWGTTLGALAGAYALTALTSSGQPAPVLGGRPNVFGVSMEPVVGYPALAASSVALFEQVALAEEILFRGLLQSGLASNLHSETGGWVLASLIFGGTHALNVYTLPEEEHASYLLVAVPYITVVGAAIGLVYQDADYSLTAPIAVHFWYDTALTMASAIADPQNTIFSIRWGGAW